MDKRLEKLEQMQKEMQEQMRAQMQEQLAKIQHDMKDQMLKSQKNMMNQISQLLARWQEKGKSPMINARENNEEPYYPPGFTLIHAQAPLEAGSGSNPGDNPINPVVLDLDEVVEGERARTESQKQLEDRCKWLEEKFREMESADSHHGIDAKDLSLLVNNISADNFIFFNDDEIPLGGTRSTKALRITTICKGYTLPGVL
ncbi:hypothetical protein PVK06_024169 [Gossypium arboreum]|uniref:Uncharacterized protein n=1 Tax=Gossypium arboreum TaxID=29729 RepID=A0ABR0PDE2_GOSAR|nr:hypothetical protein PVK06_024169 [Gossypium arboreum]